VESLIERMLIPALLVGLRIAGLMSFAPFLGSASISPRFKAILTLALTALLYPVCAPQSAVITASNWVGIVLSESFLGMMMGLVVQMVFEGAAFAGQLISIQIGISLVTILDPQTQADTPVMSALYQTIALFIFLQLDVHHWMLRALVNSYTLVPVGSITASGPLVQEFFRITGSMFTVGIEIAAPVLLATMAVDMSLSFLSKASPQLPIMFIGISIKFLLGIGVIVTAMAFWPGFFESRYFAALNTCEHLLHLAK
jgi:flagellar biosynthesis protein FliR